ncbi:MAG: GNA1162 family protein [Nitrospinaceae bacterium]
MKKASGKGSIHRSGRAWVRRIPWLILAFQLSACAADLQTKVSGNLLRLPPNQTLAILPVETLNPSQKEAAKLFRQSLYANLKQSKFHLLEHYIVDGLLKKNGLTQPSQYPSLNPMHFGEILGADAVLISRMNKVERSYLFLHSSIKISISLEMVDTRTGEILWRAEQTELDFQGIGKIPTGMASAVLAPIYFVTNKLNLNRLTSRMVKKLTAIVRQPDGANEEKTFGNTVIAKAARRDIHRLEKMERVQARWSENTPPSSQEKKKPLTAVNLFPIQPISLTVNRESGKGASRKKWGGQSIEIPTHLGPPPPHRPEVKKSHTPILYTIQVGAYKTQTLAQKMFVSLMKKGYNAFITLFRTQEKTPIYRVRVEKFKDKKKALLLAKKIEHQEKLENFVTTLPPGTGAENLGG